MRAFPDRYKENFRIFKKLNTPQKIQDYLDKLPINPEPDGDTCFSPLKVIEKQTAHCIEGAMFAAAALWYHGERPLLLDLKTTGEDYDHVVTLFKIGKKWGAISKTNHAVLRYRDPVFISIRELAMSYFNEYFLDSGKKILQSYSKPFDLSLYKPEGWLLGEKDVWQIPIDLDDSPHINLLTPKELRGLRRADVIEIEAGKLKEWPNA